MQATIVMATYNGEKYILEQLDSIRQQTRAADEVLIADDVSKDNTVSIVRDYIERYNLTSWKLICNKENKGYTRNFLDGAALSNGDVIFYCDQDDVWELEKIEHIMSGFENHSDMLACYCLRTYIHADGTLMHKHFENITNVSRATKGIQKVTLSQAIKYNKSPGLCLGIKKELVLGTRELILDNDLTHDLPIGTIAAINNGYYVLNEKLVRNRRHGENFSKPRDTISGRMGKIDQQILGRCERSKQMKAIYKAYVSQLTDKEKRLLRNAIDSTDKSIDYLKNGKTNKLFGMIFSTNPMLNNWIAVNNWAVSLRENRRKHKDIHE